MSQALYIIGNGFDIHHGMPTSYKNFRDFVDKVDADVYRRVDQFLSVEENWSDLEEALATFSMEEVSDSAGDFLMPYGAANWSDSGHHDYQYEIEQTVEALSSKLLDLMCRWIEKANVPNPADIPESLLLLDENAKFLNFNYTHTLQIAYGIPCESVLHIHGSIDGTPCDPILGHAWDPEELTPDWINSSDEDMDTRVIEGNEILKPYFEKTFKPTAEIAEANNDWFKDLHSTETIYIFGHALSQVDRCYFIELCKYINTETVTWNVSYYLDKDLDSHKDFMSLLGVSINLVHFKKLSEYAINRV